MPAIKATKEKDTDLPERHADTDNKHSQTKRVGHNNIAVTLARPLYPLLKYYVTNHSGVKYTRTTSHQLNPKTLT